MSTPDAAPPATELNDYERAARAAEAMHEAATLLEHVTPTAGGTQTAQYLAGLVIALRTQANAVRCVAQIIAKV